MSFLTRKVGFMPLWGWLVGGAAAVGGYVIYKRRQASAGSARAAVGPNSATTGSGLGYGGGGTYTLDYGPTPTAGTGEGQPITQGNTAPLQPSYFSSSFQVQPSNTGTSLGFTPTNSVFYQQPAVRWS